MTIIPTKGTSWDFLDPILRKNGWQIFSPLSGSMGVKKKIVIYTHFVRRPIPILMDWEYDPVYIALILKSAGIQSEASPPIPPA